jgi:dipicolinate synthase subunit B
MIGYALTGSFCTLSASIRQLEILRSSGLEIQPIMSERAYTTDTRFGRAEDFIKRIEALCGREIIHTIEAAEPLGPKTPLDALIISPCTGNTLAKISHGITDSAVTMAAKAHLRCDRPLLIALATNDGLSQNLGSLASLITRRSVYFVPMRQAAPLAKPPPLVAEMSLLPHCYDLMLSGEQMRPIFLEPK